MPLLHQEIREFQTVAAMRAIEVLPQDNDKFFCEETNLLYDYDPILTDPDDGLLVIALNSFSGRFQAVERESKKVVIPRPIISIRGYQEPQSYRNTGGSPPNFADNRFKIIVRYPEGSPDFEALVATGNVRLQLEHFDGKTYIKHKALGIKQRQTIIPRLAIHRNGSMDAGDYLFGGACRDNGGNLYPDRDTMLYLPSALKANQFVEFDLNPALWYGYGSAANCGVISSMLPMKYEDYLSSIYTTRCGGSHKNWFSNNTTVEKNDRIYFRFWFMYKNVLGRWERSISPSDKFYVDFKIANTDSGSGEVQRWVIGWRARFA